MKKALTSLIRLAILCAAFTALWVAPAEAVPGGRCKRCELSAGIWICVADSSGFEDCRVQTILGEDECHSYDWCEVSPNPTQPTGRFGIEGPAATAE